MLSNAFLMSNVSANRCFFCLHLWLTATLQSLQIPAAKKSEVVILNPGWWTSVKHCSNKSVNSCQWTSHPVWDFWQCRDPDCHALLSFTCWCAQSWTMSQLHNRRPEELNRISTKTSSPLWWLVYMKHHLALSCLLHPPTHSLTACALQVKDHLYESALFGSADET